MERVNVGIVGCGKISDTYFEAGEQFDILRMAACADIDLDRAEEKAEAHGIPKACTPDALASDPEIDVVVNLTPPAVHAEVMLQALEAGKHAYTEKPLAATAEEGREIVEAARERGLRVGVAPDTFLGGGLQTCRDVIDEGRIGEPIGATATWTSPGHERWHPNPDLYYQKGGGPLFDMGPYYLTALVFLLGPVSGVAGGGGTTFPTRTITSEPRYGEEIDVEVPTHETGVVDFEDGATASVTMSFDVAESDLNGFEVYGTEGTLKVSDPNRFDGPVRVHGADADDGEWEEVPVTRGNTGSHRGIGVADMAYAIRTDEWSHRSNGDLGYHVLEVMDGLREAADRNEYYDLVSTCEQPDPLPEAFPETLE